MTPEQKQRIQQIEARQNLRSGRVMLAAEGVLHDDVDFLLSLVKSQEARAFPDPRHWQPVGPPVALPAPLLPHSYEEYVLGFCPEKGRGNAILSVEGELTLLGKNVVRELSNRVATSMRSACVEKLRAIQRKHEQTLPESEDYEYDQAAAFALCLAADQLESLSIEKPKE